MFRDCHVKPMGRQVLGHVPIAGAIFPQSMGEHNHRSGLGLEQLGEIQVHGIGAGGARALASLGTAILNLKGEGLDGKRTRLLPCGELGGIHGWA